MEVMKRIDFSGNCTREKVNSKQMLMIVEIDKNVVSDLKFNLKPGDNVIGRDPDRCSIPVSTSVRPTSPCFSLHKILICFILFSINV